VDLHFYLQILASSMNLIGFVAEYLHKSAMNKNHFGSWHSWFGLTTVTLGVLFQVPRFFHEKLTRSFLELVRLRFVSIL
jgi:hypothetical protein